MASFLALCGRVAGGVLLLVAVGAAAAALLALGGRFSWTLDLFAQLTPLYGVAGLVSGAVAAVFPVARRRTILAAAAIGILAGGALIVLEWSRPTGPAAAAGAPGQIKVIQFNVLRTNRDTDRVADWLMAQNADFITLTEAPFALRDRLLALGWSPAGEHGQLLILAHSHYTAMDRPRMPFDTSLTYINGTYDTSSGPAEIVTAHVEWPTSRSIRVQTAALVTTARRLPQRRMILTGDFNSTPWSAEIRRLDHDLGLIRRDRGVATYPAQLFGRPWPLPFLPIDHVYAGPGWATVKVERGPWLGSDHYPLIVTLAPISPR